MRHPFYHQPMRQGILRLPQGPETRREADLIRVAHDTGCSRLTLDRSDKANALTRAMLAALVDGVEQAQVAGSRVLILTGTGRVFSAGADLEEMKAGLGLAPEWETLSGALAAYPGLTIAALNGTLAGGAMGLALACDLRVAVPGAQFFYPVMRLGYRPQPSDPGRLTALVGPSRAKAILLAGQRVGAEEALAWGLIDRIAPPEALNDMVLSLAADALAADPGHVQALKRMFTGGAV
jgi:enoyl-CoA hydratase/carnithine racemase